MSDDRRSTIRMLLALAIVLPLLAVIVLRHAFRQRRARLAAPRQHRRRRRGSFRRTRWQPPGWRMVRLGLASALVGVAVAGPRWGDERTRRAHRAASTWCSRSTRRCR